MQTTQQTSRNVVHITRDWCSSHTGFVVGWTTGFVLSIIYVVMV